MYTYSLARNITMSSDKDTTKFNYPLLPKYTTVKFSITDMS